MADRPQIPGWKTDKPNEYSSEFAVDGNIYANVTNVTTGQRQLYLVSGIKTPFTGSLLTNRTLITTTNADGSVVKGSGYNDFVRIYGAPKLQNAEINNKKQSDFIIPKTSTPEELQVLGKSTQYKGGINNVATPGSAAATTEAATSKAIQDTIAQVQKGVTRTSYGNNLRYPLNIKDTQDCIKIEMIEYVPKKYNQNVTSQTGTASGELFSGSAIRKPLGSVILPIQSPIGDSNTVMWGDDRMNAFEAIAAGAALKLISGKEGDGVGAGDLATKTGNEASSITALAGIAIAQAAASGTAGGNLFTRLTGSIINPNMELLFTGPNLRTFNFTFLMSAREPKEAEMIRGIIRFFKQGMSVKRAKSNLFLMSPNVFDISYLYRKNGEVIHPWMNRIKTCALQSCSVNYTPGGSYSTYIDGSMTAYEVSLLFQELTPIYDDDYEKIDSSPSPFKEIGY